MIITEPVLKLELLLKDKNFQTNNEHLRKFGGTFSKGKAYTHIEFPLYEV